MLEHRLCARKSLLRSRVIDFLTPSLHWKLPAIGFIDRVREIGWDAVLFGGVVRDSMWPQLVPRPRDIDIVVAGVGVSDIEHHFGRLVERRTRFGGLRLVTGEWHIDVWPLQETWGIKATGMAPTFENLVRTTFLNIEAIAVSLPDLVTGECKVYEHGFFEGVERRIVDINMVENPFPELCVVRSLILAAKCELLLSWKLAQLLISQIRASSAAALEQAQVSHYGAVILSWSEILRWAELAEDRAKPTGMDAALAPPKIVRNLALI